MAGQCTAVAKRDSERKLAAARKLVERLGSIDKAKAALEELKKLQKAA